MVEYNLTAEILELIEHPQVGVPSDKRPSYVEIANAGEPLMILNIIVDCIVGNGNAIDIQILSKLENCYKFLGSHRKGLDYIAKNLVHTS